MNNHKFNDDTYYLNGGENLELKRKDGTIVKGKCYVYDYLFNGESEYPVFHVELEDGSNHNLHHFEHWRLV